MKETTKEKIQLGKQKYLDEKIGLVCQIGKDIKIFVDTYQYILKIGSNGSRAYYFATIEGVMEELMNMKAKELMLQKNEKNLDSVRQSICESKEWLEEIVRPSFSEHIDRKS